jgi:hypothetical protein
LSSGATVQQRHTSTQRTRCAHIVALRNSAMVLEGDTSHTTPFSVDISSRLFASCANIYGALVH